MYNVKKLYFMVNKYRLIIICSLFLLALFVRLYKINTITPGMYGDELVIAHGSEKLLNDKIITPYIDLNTGHPTPLLYLTALSIKLFGRNLTAIRLPSALFGALDLVIFYILISLFLNNFVAILATIGFMFSYPHIIVSRFAYEMTANIYFEILSAIFLYLWHKTKKDKYLIWMGISLGLGLYTYVGFRFFSILFLMITLYLIWNKNYKIRLFINKTFLLVLPLFIITIPLLIFAIIHGNIFWFRTSSLFIFSQRLPFNELIKELTGNIIRLGLLFLPHGDPNIRQNPGNNSMFDLITVGLFFAGGIYLFIKKRKFFWINLIILIVLLLNDILTLERIPEMHYYGLGHPNTLRISGILPLVYLWFGYGIFIISNKLNRFNGYIKYGIPVIIVMITAFINWNLYFNQRPLSYIYQYNNVDKLEVAKNINNSGDKTVYLSDNLLNNEFIKYFSNPNIKFQQFNPANEIDALKIITRENMVVIDPLTNISLSNRLLNDAPLNTKLFSLKLINSPDGNTYEMIFRKNR
jgi:4-amino-4-deoxy-L-arabinose transferase-like glycosyltransferase